MVESIEPIEAVKKKRESRWADAIQAASLPILQNFAGLILPHYFSQLIIESGKSVASRASENDRLNREEKKEWSIEDKKTNYFRRIYNHSFENKVFQHHVQKIK